MLLSISIGLLVRAVRRLRLMTLNLLTLSLAVLVSQPTSVAPSNPPQLLVDADLLSDEIAVVGAQIFRPVLSKQITETIFSPPVSLAALTEGLVSGDGDGADPSVRQADRALNLALRLLAIDR